jgi:hypothetical protein
MFASQNGQGPLLGTYLKKCESSYNKGTGTPMSIAAPFTTAKPWKEPRCLTTDGSRKCIYTEWNFTQPQKKNETLSFAGKWMELENIILSEVSLIQKAKSRTFSLMEYRPDINTAILRETGQTEGRSHVRGVVLKKEVKKVNVVDVLSIQE